MAAVLVSVEIDRTPAEVWAGVRDIASHVEWMADATEIRFVSDHHEGVGTTFECDTKVGPLTTTDVMEITAWDEGERMGVRHVGVVTGEGAFTLHPLDDGARTEFRWAEDLSFPWFLGGAIGEFVGRPVLAAIWRRNLRRLKQRIEADEAGAT